MKEIIDRIKLIIDLLNKFIYILLNKYIFDLWNYKMMKQLSLYQKNRM